MEALKVWIVGGEDVHLRLPLARALQARGFLVTLAGSADGTLFRDQGIAYHHYNLARSLSPLEDLKSLSELRRLFRTHRPDCIQAFDTKPSILVPPAAAWAGVRGSIRTINGMGFLFSSESVRARLLRPVYRWLHRRASSVTRMTVFQNREDRDYFVEHGMARLDRSEVVYGSGVDVREIQTRADNPATARELRADLGLEGKLVVTMVSRLVIQKGVREYLAMARRVRRLRQDVAFLLVGQRASEGDQAIPLREIEAHAGDVHYLGARTDVPAILAASHLFVLPSYYREGIPRVLLEAGALGLPLIATDMPGCRDVVRRGWNGLLVPRRDVSALTEAVERLLSSPEDRERMGARAREHVSERFSLSTVAEAYAQIYRWVADDSGTALRMPAPSPGVMVPSPSRPLAPVPAVLHPELQTDDVSGQVQKT